MSDYKWVSEYIGKKYEFGGRGPDAFDCWGLVMDVFKRRGIDLPDWTADSDTTRAIVNAVTDFTKTAVVKNYALKVDSPQDYDIALVKRSRDAHHVGVYVAGGILHATRGCAAIVHNRLTDFAACGTGTVEWYRWRDGEH